MPWEVRRQTGWEGGIARKKNKYGKWVHVSFTKQQTRTERGRTSEKRGKEEDVKLGREGSIHQGTGNSNCK